MSIPCQIRTKVVLDDNSRGHVVVEDFGGGLTSIQLMTIAGTIQVVMAESGLAQLHEQIGEIVAKHQKVERARRIKAVK